MLPSSRTTELATWDGERKACKAKNILVIAFYKKTASPRMERMFSSDAWQAVSKPYVRLRDAPGPRKSEPGHLGTLRTPKGNGGLQLQLCSARGAQIQVGTPHRPQCLQFPVQLPSSLLQPSAPLPTERSTMCEGGRGSLQGRSSLGWLVQSPEELPWGEPRRWHHPRLDHRHTHPHTKHTGRVCVCVCVSWSTCSHFWAQGDQLSCVHCASVRTPHPWARGPWETASRGMGTQGTNADLLA